MREPPQLCIKVARPGLEPGISGSEASDFFHRANWPADASEEPAPYDFTVDVPCAGLKAQSPKRWAAKVPGEHSCTWD